MSKIKAYMSHSIRGKYGNDATNEQMKINNDSAIAVGDALAVNCPNLEIYVPGRMDGYLLRQGVKPLDIVDALLTLDCAIISTTNLLLMYTPDDYVSEGMKIELKHALLEGKQVVYFSDVSVTTILRLNTIISNMMNKENNNE